MLVPGSAGSTAVGRTEKQADGSGSSNETLASHSFVIPGLIDLGLANASVSTAVGSNITSAVNLNLGAVDMLNGFVTIDGGSSDTDTLANATKSRVRREITISGLHTFSLADLFREMGASPLDLTCGAVQDVGAEMGVDTAAACVQLAAAEQAVSDGKDLLSGAAADMLAAKNAVLDDITTATATQAAVVADIAAKEADRVAAVADLVTAQASRDEAVAARDALEADRDVLTAQRDDLEAQTAGLATRSRRRATRKRRSVRRCCCKR